MEHLIGVISGLAVLWTADRIATALGDRRYFFAALAAAGVLGLAVGL